MTWNMFEWCGFCGDLEDYENFLTNRCKMSTLISIAQPWARKNIKALKSGYASQENYKRNTLTKSVLVEFYFDGWYANKPMNCTSWLSTRHPFIGLNLNEILEFNHHARFSPISSTFDYGSMLCRHIEGIETNKIIHLHY